MRLLSRLMPKSLLGQMLLAVALALLVAQTVSAVLLWRAGDNRRDQAALNSAAFRLVTEDSRQARRDRDERASRGGNAEAQEGLREGRRQGARGERQGGRRGEQRKRLLPNDRPGRLPRALRIEQSEISPLLPGETREPEMEAELTSILEREGVAVDRIVVFKRLARTDTFIRSRPRLLKRVSERENAAAILVVAGIQTGGEEGWRVARVIKSAPQSGSIRTIILQTLLIYLILVGLHFLLLRRITKPLQALTQKTEAFGNGSNDPQPMEPEGPEDIKRLITAHNAMEGRIAALLDEKDVMLGAIGHDLKTPLAALRVRIESVENENERAKMAASIEDITHSLDDILSLARVGRATTAPEKAELSALVGSVVEEFEDMGKPVALGAAPRIAQPVHVTWLKRGLRNLIGNALRYAGTASVSLVQTQDNIILRVDDEGPGIPDNRIADMLEPFTRGDASRNRDTGGAGLGLTLARAIAEQHGGKLVLENRETGGLRAEIWLPIAS